MRAWPAIASLLLLACGTTPARTAPLRTYYVPPSAPACVDDEGERGASIAVLRFDEGDAEAEAASLAPPRSIPVRAAYDCTVVLRSRTMRLSTSESLAEACRPTRDQPCAFVRSCWVIGGPADRACDASDAAHASWLFGLLDDDGPSIPGLVERDPAGRHDVPTVFVVSGDFSYGQGHLVQRVDGAWRVVVSALVWQS